MPCCVCFFCFTVWLIFCVVEDIFVFVVPVWVGVGHLFLQLLPFTGHDHLLSGPLLGDMLHLWPLGSLLGSLFVYLPSEGSVLIYSLVPDMWHLANARFLLILLAVVSWWMIYHAMLKGVLKWLSWKGWIFTQMEMKVLLWLLFHMNSPEQGSFSSMGPVMVDFLHRGCSLDGSCDGAVFVAVVL